MAEETKKMSQEVPTHVGSAETSPSKSAEHGWRVAQVRRLSYQRPAGYAKATHYLFSRLLEYIPPLEVEALIETIRQGREPAVNLNSFLMQATMLSDYYESLVSIPSTGRPYFLEVTKDILINALQSSIDQHDGSGIMWMPQIVGFGWMKEADEGTLASEADAEQKDIETKYNYLMSLEQGLIEEKKRRELDLFFPASVQVLPWLVAALPEQVKFLFGITHLQKLSETMLVAILNRHPDYVSQLVGECVTTGAELVGFIGCWPADYRQAVLWLIHSSLSKAFPGKSILGWVRDPGELVLVLNLFSLKTDRAAVGIDLILEGGVPFAAGLFSSKGRLAVAEALFDGTDFPALQALEIRCLQHIAQCLVRRGQDGSNSPRVFQARGLEVEGSFRLLKFLHEGNLSLEALAEFKGQSFTFLPSVEFNKIIKEAERQATALSKDAKDAEVSFTVSPESPSTGKA